jgi:hypothetical protein
MSRYRIEAAGELWWVGYDKASASYFADRDLDLDREEYDAPSLPRFTDLEQAIAGELSLPGELRSQLAAEQPARIDTVEARATGRIDQVAAELRDGYEEALELDLQRIIDVNRRNFPTSATEIIPASPESAEQDRGYRAPQQQGRSTEQGFDR